MAPKPRTLNLEPIEGNLDTSLIGAKIKVADLEGCPLKQIDRIWLCVSIYPIFYLLKGDYIVRVSRADSMAHYPSGQVSRILNPRNLNPKP